MNMNLNTPSMTMKLSNNQTSNRNALRPKYGIRWLFLVVLVFALALWLWIPVEVEIGVCPGQCGFVLPRSHCGNVLLKSPDSLAKAIDAKLVDFSPNSNSAIVQISKLNYLNMPDASPFLILSTEFCEANGCVDWSWTESSKIPLEIINEIQQEIFEETGTVWKIRPTQAGTTRKGDAGEKGRREREPETGTTND